jgi:hypothetical protein
MQWSIVLSGSAFASSRCLPEGHVAIQSFETGSIEKIKALRPIFRLDTGSGMYECNIMMNGELNELTECRRFFLEPRQPKQRMYEALRAYFVEGRRSKEVASAFGYRAGSFRVLCHQFRRDPALAFFRTSPRGPRTQPRKSAARGLIEKLRKQNCSVYEISTALK